VGVTFFKAGLLKYNSWEFAVKLFEDEYRVPLLDPSVAARIAMIQELTIPILLFLGLATRAATVPLLGMIAVIQIFVYSNAYNDHLVWGSILVLVLTRGPGVFSLDYLIERLAAKRRTPMRPMAAAPQ
jgi:putative oxidoreductase